MHKYLMRQFIDIVSGKAINEGVATIIVQRYDPDQTEYPIYRNGSKRDVARIIRGMKDHPDRHIRGLLDPDGNLYFWDAFAASHIEIIRKLGLAVGSLHLVLKDKAVQLGWGRQQAPDDATIAAESDTIRSNAHIRSIYGRGVTIDIARTVTESVIGPLTFAGRGIRDTADGA